MSLWSVGASAQDTDVWTVFYNPDSTLIGYKDAYGKVAIAPKFSPFVTAITFADIVGDPLHI